LFDWRRRLQPEDILLYNGRVGAAFGSQGVDAHLQNQSAGQTNRDFTAVFHGVNMPFLVSNTIGRSWLRGIKANRRRKFPAAMQSAI
jgi:hypothetical protein